MLFFQDVIDEGSFPRTKVTWNAIWANSVLILCPIQKYIPVTIVRGTFAVVEGQSSLSTFCVPSTTSAGTSSSSSRSILIMSPLYYSEVIREVVRVSCFLYLPSLEPTGCCHGLWDSPIAGSSLISAAGAEARTDNWFWEWKKQRQHRNCHFKPFWLKSRLHIPDLSVLLIIVAFL